MRIQEAERLGLERIFVPRQNQDEIDLSNFSIEVVFLSKVNDLLQEVFS